MTFVGDVLPDFGFTVTSNSTGALTAPSTFTVVLTAPDGTTPTVTVTNTSTGVYAVTFVATMAGRWRAVGTAVGNGTDGSSELVWNVDEFAELIVSVAEAQAFIGESRDSQQDAVRDVLDAASDVVENYTGRVWRRQTVVETYDGGRATIPLRSTPVLSVTGVTENGAATTNFTLDQASGLLHKGTTTSGGTWVWGRQNVVVTYIVGATSVPNPVRRAVLDVARLMWEQRRGGVQRQSADEYAEPRDLIPREDRLALDAYRAPGF